MKNMKKILVIFFVGFLFLGCTHNNPKIPSFSSMANIRESAVAGTFYPKDKNILQENIKNLLKNIPEKRLAPPLAIIVPHAGLEFSGETAAKAFAQIKGFPYKKVFLIGPSHYEYFSGASILDVDFYETPLGFIKISPIAKTLLKNKIFTEHRLADAPEHSLEVELPFLQTVLGKDFELIPILVGADNSFANIQEIANLIKPHLDDETLVVISSDFVHYGPNYGYVPFFENQAEEIKRIDESAFKFIYEKNSRRFYDKVKNSKVTIDGGTVIPIALELFKDSEIERLKYETSGHLLNDFTNSVSYASFAFYDRSDLTLTETEKNWLKDLAKKSIHTAISRLPFSISETRETIKIPRLTQKQSSFVTLKKEGYLRGCIGQISPHDPLYLSVSSNAESAATRDPRFDPVTEEEWPNLDLKISILSVPILLEKETWQEKFDTIRPGIDGIILKNGFYQAVYLPQVWEDVPEKDLFLSSLSEKAGLPKEAWKDKKTHWYTFQALEF